MNSPTVTERHVPAPKVTARIEGGSQGKLVGKVGRSFPSIHTVAEAAAGILDREPPFDRRFTDPSAE
jgi:predicted RNA-binding protein YlqC (UPF0109 family)